jgi:hypothetical protein
LQSKDIYERLMRHFDGVARNPLAVAALSRLRSKMKSMRSILVKGYDLDEIETKEGQRMMNNPWSNHRGLGAGLRIS